MNPKSPHPPAPSSPGGASAARAVRAEFAAWLAKYGPVEREIIEARERRLVNTARRRAERFRALGDLHEATGGLAATWLRDGLSPQDMLELAGDDVWTLDCLFRCFRRSATLRIDRLRHAVKRPLYYAAENARRRELAAERRRIAKRRTLNPCPTREQILDAWVHRRESHEAAVRFGSLLEDLECYLDNSLRFDGDGAICGRSGGIKRWLQTEIPALYLRYTTVMRYKAAAKKLRQIVGVSDSVPAAAVVDRDTIDQAADERDGAGHAEARRQDGTTAGKRDQEGKRDYVADEITLLRARAIWLEVVEGISGNPTALMERLDALLDPERVEEANMLAEWRRRYANEITLRTKDKWWIRLWKRSG